jgi:hypothetical protein
MILKSLKEFSGEIISAKPKAGDRIDLAVEYFKSKTFTRKDYMNLFKEISSATASRDLAQGVASRLLKITGNKSQAIYRLNKKQK